MGTNYMQFRALFVAILVLSMFTFLPNITFGETEWNIYKLSVKDQVFKIPYKITNADITKIEIYPDFTGVLVTIKSDPKNDGTMEITLPRNLLDARTPDGRDDRFTVLVNGGELGGDREPQELVKSPCFRNILIKFPAGTKEIEVIVTRIPEIPRSTQSTVAAVYVTTDKSNYQPKEIIKIAGCTSLALDDKQVTLQLIDPEGNINPLTSLSPDINGSFSASVVIGYDIGYQLPSNSTKPAMNGAYIVKATYAGHTATSSFVVPEFPVNLMMMTAIALGVSVVLRVICSKVFLQKVEYVI